MTFKAEPYYILFEGQSLLREPSDPVGHTVPEVLMTRFPTTGWANVSRSGVGFTGLVADYTQRVEPYTSLSPQSVAVLLGGTTDIFWENDLGTKIYDDIGVEADLLHASGITYVLVCTITPFSGEFGGMELHRTDANTAILADAGNKFDSVVDIASISGLDNPASGDYSDGLHLSDAGVLKVCNALEPAIITLLPDIPLEV